MFEIYIHPLSSFLIGWQFDEEVFEIHLGLFSFCWRFRI